jgi:UDP-3-O-[3-hydroxymyristoyl] N-acetylglucosamine deacetylase / 3-hydroxyacyl-[acyl-carrier-protein] dehydratase
MKQTTLSSNVSLSGKGLHTGQFVNVTILPASANHGIKFRRIDLDKPVTIVADCNKVTVTTRSTVLQQGEATVGTVEHLLSALIGTDVDNALIEIDGPEVPILDGSAAPFFTAIKNAGIVELEENREVFVIEKPIFYSDEATGAEYVALPSKYYEINCVIDFNSAAVGQQIAISNVIDYEREIAPARTFVFLHEIAELLEQNLIKGGDLDNAIVIASDMPSATTIEKLQRLLQREDIKVEKEGYLNVTPLRFANELARHKTLDLIGDLALVGKKIQGKIMAIKPGHAANVAFAKVLKNAYAEAQKGVPNYDPNQKPIFDTMEIAAQLPHRYPFLLVDKIIEMSEKHVVGVKNITFNEQYFQGHFPNNPVMPGVLQIEAMAQTGGILALSTVPDPGNWDTYFLKIDETKFKQKVVPGDTILFKLELLEPIRRGIVIMKGTAFVGNKVVSEANLTAQIVRRTTNETTSA